MTPSMVFDDQGLSRIDLMNRDKQDKQNEKISIGNGLGVSDSNADANNFKNII